jgi:hypothetical protein
MDVESNSDGEKEKESYNISASCPVFKSNGVRCGSDIPDGIDRFLIQCELGIILPFSFIFWSLFLLFKD